jgi:predicted Zn-dependent protease
LRLRNLLLAAAFALALAAAAHAAIQSEAKTYTHEAGGITFELPAGWKAEPHGAQITASPAEGGISVAFWVTEEDEFDAATDAVGKELDKLLDNVKLDGEPKEDTHNGMQHASVSGTGQIEGHDVLFSADILQAKKPVIVLTFGVADQLHKHAEEYSKLVKSIKKVG